MHVSSGKKQTRGLNAQHIFIHGYNSSTRLLLLIATEKRLQVAGGGASNTCLNDPCSQKVWIVVGPDLEIKKV